METISDLVVKGKAEKERAWKELFFLAKQFANLEKELGYPEVPPYYTIRVRDGVFSKEQKAWIIVNEDTASDFLSHLWLLTDGQFATGRGRYEILDISECKYLPYGYIREVKSLISQLQRMK